MTKFILPNKREIEITNYIGNCFGNVFKPNRAMGKLILHYCPSLKDGDLIKTEKLTFKVFDCWYSSETYLCTSFSMELIKQ